MAMCMGLAGARIEADLLMKCLRCIILIVAGWYLALVTVHYFNQRLLWNDEQCILKSIEGYSVKEIFSQPLASLQVFPRGYIFAIQQFAGQFHHHLLALRFLPFVCMIGAFVIWARVAALELRSTAWLIIYLLTWTASIPLVYYAAELKQYSMDVLACGVCLWFLYRGFNCWWCLLPLFSLVSYPSVFWMPIFAWNLCVHVRQTRQWMPLAIYSAAALSALALSYHFDLSVSGGAVVGKHWQDHFISFDSVQDFFKSLGQGFDNLTSRWFAERPKWIRGCARVWVGGGFIYLACSAWQQFKRDGFIFKSAISAAGALYLIHFFLGALHKYPFVVPRTSLFFAPILFMATVMVIRWVQEKNKIAGQMMAAIFIVYLMIISSGIASAIFAGDLGAQTILWARL